MVRAILKKHDGVRLFRRFNRLPLWLLTCQMILFDPHAAAGALERKQTHLVASARYCTTLATGSHKDAIEESYVVLSFKPVFCLYDGASLRAVLKINANVASLESAHKNSVSTKNGGKVL